MSAEKDVTDGREILFNRGRSNRQRCISFLQAREGSKSLAASGQWQKPPANQSISVEYLDVPCFLLRAGGNRKNH